MSWYKTGTIAVTNGSANVTGTGTAWIANASIGEGLVGPDGRQYEIAGISSDTAMTISPAYLGSTASGQIYAIAPLRGRIAQLLSETSSLLASFATVRDGIGAGLFPDGTVSLPAFRFAADQDTGVFRPAANTLGLVTGGTERMRIAASGNVGIGLTNPGYPLAVQANAGSGAIRLVGRAADSISTLEFSDSAQSVTQGLIQSNGNNLLFGTSATERMRIDSAGNIGIGTSTPGALLGASSGALGTTAGNTATITKFFGSTTNERALTTRLIRNTNGSDWTTTTLRLQNSIDVTESAYIDFSPNGTHDLAFGTGAGATERMRIDNSGNVGIGTSAPDYKLDVNGAIGFTPGASVTPVDNGDVVFELTNNTTLTIKARGSDGVVRSGTITLA